jgi:putative peptidoglycan lipid II flippase
MWSASIAALSLAATITLLLIGVRTVWVIVPLVVLNIAFVVSSWPRPAKRLDDRAIKTEIRRFIRLAVVGTLASAGFTQLAILLAASVNGLEYAGTYAAASTLTAPITMLASALGSVLFPALASAHASGHLDELRNRLDRSTSQLTTLVMFVCIPALILAAPVVQLLWGAAFADTAWILLFSVPAVALGAISSPAVSSITSESNRGMAVSAISSVCGAVVGVIVWACTIPFVPVVAIPLGYLTGITIVATVPWIIAWRQFSMRWAGESITVVISLCVCVAASIGLQRATAPLWLTLAVSVLALSAWTIARRRHLRESVMLFTALRRR